MDIEGAVPSTEIRTVQVDGQFLRVGIRRGLSERPPLLLFNGIGANLELAGPFTAALGDIETVIFDVPGGEGTRRPTGLAQRPSALSPATPSAPGNWPYMASKLQFSR